MGSVPDGTYAITGCVIRLLAGSNKTQDQLRAIAKVVKSARDNTANAPAAIQDIKSSAPELGSIADTLPQD
jgi:hypothetical protein